MTHRRAGKTVALINDIILGARTALGRRPIAAYIGPTFTQAKRVAWQYLKDYSAALWARPPSESELKVTIKVGNGDTASIFCLGADNPDSLRGIYLDAAVLDEYALFRPSVFSQIIRPALSDRNGWGVFASTPRGRNLFYEIYQAALQSPEEYHLTLLSAETSGIIPPEELDDLRKHMDPEEFAQEYLCSFDSALKGAIYAEEVNQLFLDQRISTVDIYDPHLPTHVAFDFGFTDATVAIYWQVAPGDSALRIVNVDATSGKDIFYHIDNLLRFQGEGPLGQIWLPHDARAKNLQTGLSIVEQFLKNDIRPQIVPNHKVRDRLAAARAIFPRIVFNKGTDDLIEALKSYRRDWDEKTLMFSDTPLHDWASDYADAFGYMCLAASPALAPGAPKVVAPSTFTLSSLFQDYEDSMKGSQRRIQ